MKNSFALIDKPSLFGAIALLLTIVFPLIMFPTPRSRLDYVLHFIYDRPTWFLVPNAGWLVPSWFTLCSVTWDKLNWVKLMKNPEFKTASWAAMLFCGGIGASIFCWVVLSGLTTINHHLSN
ncbi:BCCT family transporter [Vibrio lentus]|nr:BCCT family transporter [Vibrio lentus]